MAIGREVQTQAFAMLVSYITGRYPTIERYGDYNSIILDSDQIEKAQDYLTDLIEGEPGEVRIEVNNIIFPVLLKKYWPWLVGIPAGLVTVGFLLRRK